MKKHVRKILTVMLAAIMLFCAQSFMFAQTAEADTDKQYDPDTALAQASSLLEATPKSGSRCASYVSSVLRAGGLTNVKQSGAGDLIDFLNNPKNFDGVAIGSVITNPKYSDLEPGDIIACVCVKSGDATTFANGHKKGTGKYYGLHVLIISEVGQDYIRVYAATNHKYNELVQLSCNDGNYTVKCTKCGNSNHSKWIAFCFSDEIKGKTTTKANEEGVVYNWAQGDARWKKLYNGINWSKACAVDAIAIQLARTNLVAVDESASSINTNTMSGFNPASFAKLAVSKNAVSSSSSVSWRNIKKVVPGFEVAEDKHFGKATSQKGFSYYPAKSEQDIIEAMKYYLDQGYYPVIEGPGSTWKSNGGRHYVAVISVTDADVRVIDPCDGKEKSLFDVKLGKSEWTFSNIEKCGDPNGYGCAVLFKAR